MAEVGYEEQTRRGGIALVFIVALVLSEPLIGWIAAPFATLYFAGRALFKSDLRLLDIPLAIGGFVLYALVLYLIFPMWKAERVGGMWFVMGLYSLGWVWLLQWRFNMLGGD